jgi:hypothetical protein
MTTEPTVWHDITELGTVAFVGAHPDDETFVAGGVLAAAAHLGQAVAVLTATRGEAGVRDPRRWPPARLGKIREWEQHEALKILGVFDQTNLGYTDGQCAEMPVGPAVAHIRKWLDGVFFAIEQPPYVPASECELVFELPVELLELKRAALAAMPSQYEALMPDLAPGGILIGGLSIEAFVRA